jgi:hypothetical protein
VKEPQNVLAMTNPEVVIDQPGAVLEEQILVLFHFKMVTTSSLLSMRRIEVISNPGGKMSPTWENSERPN